MRSFELLNRLSKTWQHIHGIAQYAIVGSFEEWRFRIFIDHHDHFRAVTTGKVLNSARDTGSYVQVRTDGTACLAYVFVVRPPVRIGYRA